jgi:hypothetical protein
MSSERMTEFPIGTNTFSRIASHRVFLWLRSASTSGAFASGECIHDARQRHHGPLLLFGARGHPETHFQDVLGCPSATHLGPADDSFSHWLKRVTGGPNCRLLIRLSNA